MASWRARRRWCCDTHRTKEDDISGNAHTTEKDRHAYSSGVGHFTAPGDEVFPCCDKRPDDPIHIPREPEKVCDCDFLGFRHYYDSRRCPETDIVPHPDWVHPRTKTTVYSRAS